MLGTMKEGQPSFALYCQPVGLRLGTKIKISVLIWIQMWKFFTLCLWIYVIVQEKCYLC